MPARHRDQAVIEIVMDTPPSVDAFVNGGDDDGSVSSETSTPSSSPRAPARASEPAALAVRVSASGESSSSTSRGGIASSNASVYAFMVSSHARNDGILFKNGSNEFKIMVRPSFDESDDPQEDAQFQVCIIADPNDPDDVREAVELEFEGVYDEEDDTTVIVHEIPVFKMSELKEDSKEVDDVRKRVNEVYEWRVCHCGKRFIKNGEDSMCLLCVLTASDKERAALKDEDRECSICFDPCGERFAKRLKCCGAHLHDRCSRKWLAAHMTCPRCRAPVENRIERIIDLLN
jgi:hypothetical protein